MQIDRLSSSAKKLDTLFKVLRRIIIVCIIVELCVMTVLTIANALKPGVVIGEALNEVDLGGVTFVLSEEYTPDNAAILGYSWACIVPETLLGVSAIIALGCIRKILAPMKENRPFHADIAAQIKKLALLSLVLGIAKNIAETVEIYAGMHAFGLNSFAGEGFIQAVSADYSWDFSYIVVFFVLMLLRRVFLHGAQLQRLEDETL